MFNSSTQSINYIRRENEDKYKDQIEQLLNMGFTNRTNILQSLIVSDGNIEHAINYYLSVN